MSRKDRDFMIKGTAETDPIQLSNKQVRARKHMMSSGKDKPVKKASSRREKRPTPKSVMVMRLQQLNTFRARQGLKPLKKLPANMRPAA